MRRAGWFALGLLLLCSVRARAQDADEIPLVGRPALLPFSEASARFARAPDGTFVAPFAVTTTAAPTELKPRSTTTLVVTLRALGPTVRPPVRIDLRLVPEFKRLFDIEDVTDTKTEKRDRTTWRYRYRLTPRSAEVDAIPGFPLVFYNPDLQPPEKAFQVLYADPIAIHQTPGRITTGPAEVDDDVVTLADGPGVLRRDAGKSGPGPISWITGIFAPPLVSVLCYLVWRRLNPDAARRTARRRSRAARTAIARLRRAVRDDRRQQAEQLIEALAGYLNERFDFGPREPTPEEVSMHLARHGFPERLVQKASALLADCAAARFSPWPGLSDLVEPLCRLVVELEEASCPG